MNKKILQRLLRYVRPYTPLVLLSLLCSAAGVVFTLAVPVFTGNAIDLMLGKGNVDFGKLRAVILFLVGSAILATLFRFAAAYLNSSITGKTVHDLRCRMFEKLQHVPLSYIDSHPHGDLINRATNDIDMVSDGLLQAFSQLFTGTLTIVGTLLFMFRESGIITAAVVLLTPLSLLTAAFIAKGSFKYFTRQSVLQGEITANVKEYFSAQKLLIAFGQQSGACEKNDEINGRLKECGYHAQFYSALVNPTTRFVNSLVYAAAGVLGSVIAMGGSISVGSISVFLSYANQYTKPFNEISGIVTQLQSAFASAGRIFDVIDTPDEPKDKISEKESASGISVQDEKKGCIDIEHLYFSYTDSPLIEDFCLHAPAGSRIAIVGPTGCGKTTMINLLLRFYEPDSGRILIDGVPTGNMSRDELRAMFGMVLQDTWLFAGTVAENISYGNPQASREEIIEAAKKAHAHSFIKRLENGYDTAITAGGDNLSEGQKQLLCIARVMLAKTPMLILDEATSGIDTRTEIKVQRAFTEMMQGKTSIVIAHRLSTIMESDIIIVMKNGHIVEQGKHAELVARGGFYSELVNAMKS